MHKDLKQKGNFADLINSTVDEYSGVLIVDKNGIIVHVSAKFSEYLFGVSSEEVEGKNIQEFNQQTELIEVINTGIPQFGRIWRVNGQQLVVSRFPIAKNGEIQGAISTIIFRRLDEAHDLMHQMLGEDEQLDYYKKEVKRLWGAKYSFDSIIGNSLAIIEAKRQAWDIAATRSPVLINGETGTGKELFAHAIHQDSPQKDGPFVVVNCAGIPANLVESELFGYDAGAFTGARKEGKPGKFELAHTGSIFLDEISELPIYMQAKLLRVLQEHEIERVGGTSVVPVHVRVISATNRDLAEMVSKAEFREDLYYRLNVFSVNIPALRERLEDISTISHHYVTRFNEEVGTKIRGISDEAIELMISYDWPGNVRELKSTIERACLDAKMGLIKPENLYYIKHRFINDDDKGNMTLKEARMKAERDLILKTLRKTGGNKKYACEIMNINRTSFYKKLRELDLEDQIRAIDN